MTDFFDSFTDLTIAGGPVRLYRGGNEHGQPVLLLHGAMLDTAKGVWWDVAPALTPEHHVHVIDIPRHGGSRPWKGVLDDAFFRRFLDELLDALGLPQVALIGLSLGGGLATGYALDHPERVSALIAVGPGGIGAKRPAQFLTWLTMRVPGAMRLCTWYLARFPDSIRKSMDVHLTAGKYTAGFERIVEFATQEARAKHAHGEGALDDWQIASFGPFAMRLNNTPDLHRLHVPTLWVRGERDRAVSDRMVVDADAATPNSRLVTMPDAGHIVTYDRPEAFTILARDFLAESRAADSERSPEPGKRS